MSEEQPKAETKKQTAAITEEEFYNLLVELPKEFQEKWLDRYEDPIEDEEVILEEFVSFLRLRKGALKSKIDIYPDVPEEIVKEIKAFNERVDGVYENATYFLGSGRTAKVYSVPEASRICVKFIYFSSPIDISIDDEVYILNKIRNFAVSGIRTPKTYFKQVSFGDRHYYGMEKIKGRDLSQIISDPKTNIDLIVAAKKVDPDVVLRNLTDYIKALYTEHKITHGDLRQSNIMMDAQGEVYVIDFGKGKTELVGEDNEAELERDLNLMKSEVKEFFKSIDRITI